MMRLRVSRIRTAIHVCAGLAFALALWSCGKTTPAGPTPIGDVRVQQGASVTSAAPDTQLALTSVSWSCLTAGTASTFGSPADCPAPRFSAQAIQEAAALAAPINLQHMVDGTTVRLRWTAPPGPDQPTSYVIEAGSAPGLSNLAAFDTRNVETTLTVTGVPRGAYFVRVRGRNAAGTGPASNEVVVIVGGGPGPGPCVGPPGAPQRLVAAVIGSTIALFWEEPTSGCEAESFVVRVGSTPGSSNLAQIDTGFPTLSFSVAGVPSGVYYVRVHARTGSTIGPASNEAVVTVTGVPPPGTSVFIGLVANGDGVTITDPECGGGGVLRLDLRVTLVQTGSTINGVSTITIRSAPNCPEGVGLTDSQPVTGTVTGSLASGSGTITATIGSGSEMGLLNGTFANGRMTGTVAFADGAAGTFAANRQ